MTHDKLHKVELYTEVPVSLLEEINNKLAEHLRGDCKDTLVTLDVRYIRAITLRRAKGK